MTRFYIYEKEMAYENNISNTLEVIPSFNVPSKLSSLAADAVIRLLVYEDYEDCNFYRWDPVIIWQFETHQPKKKKAAKKAIVDNAVYGHPPPPWKGVRKLRNWWYDESAHLLGHLVESPLRQLVLDALERRSWTSRSEEEDILFLLLRLCMDTHLQFSSRYMNENWFSDLAQIIENLGPYPLQKLIVGNDVFQGNTLILSTIIQNSPNLQILRISQWELSNDILFSLASRCPLLQEFSIHGMEPDVFMSDEAFFKCFFAGMSPEEVLECHKTGTTPQVSFCQLKYVDILFCKQMERLVLMLAYFYPNVSLSAFDIPSDSEKLAEPFLGVNAKMPFLRVCGRLHDILNDKLHSCVTHSSSVKELRLHIDDKIPGADSDNFFQQQLQIASQKLKRLIADHPSIDSLALRPHIGVDITKIVLPSFSANGNLLRCLHFTYDFSPLFLNTLYQLVNLCPLLEKLILEVTITVKDSSSKSFRTTLREHPTLETVVLQDLEIDVDEDDENEENEANQQNEVPTAYCVILRDILQNCPNLTNLAMQMWDNYDANLLASLGSKSLERLHLCLNEGYCSRWISSFLASFPNLKLMSLEGGSQDIWSESLEALSRKGISVTQKKQEFANIFHWPEKNASSTESVFIMVM